MDRRHLVRVWGFDERFGEVVAAFGARTTPRSTPMSFGGDKQSGWDRECGREVLELYTQMKAVYAQPFRATAPAS